MCDCIRFNVINLKENVGFVLSQIRFVVFSGWIYDFTLVVDLQIFSRRSAVYQIRFQTKFDN